MAEAMIAVFLPGLAVAALAIVGRCLVAAALRRQTPMAVLEAIRPATVGDSSPQWPVS
jgi:hypothetical protein